MPLYEEKLICPLAVRFTQDHIRPKFKDGRELGDSVHQIQTKPGFDGYDFLLEAPFPHIEIIRWSQLDTEATEANADHWFTLDNRRLYCLQHVAASLWPKKCAVRVEVLYAACHGIKKKDTSCTVGRKVVIKHSDKHAEKQSDLWDWRAAVQVGIETRLRRALRGIKEEDISWAHEFVACEDKKATTEELLDAPEVSSPLGYANLDRASSADDVSTDIDSASTSGKTSSDSSPRVTLKEKEEEEEAMSCNNILSQDCDILSALQSAVKGSWTGNQAESYDIRECKEEATWTCVRWNANGSSNKYTLWYDAESNCISWGRDWSYYVDASEFLEDPASLQWYRGSAKKKDAPVFRWYRATRRANSATSNHRTAGKLVSTEQTEACLTWYPSKRSSKTYQSKAQTKVQGQCWAVTGK